MTQVIIYTNQTGGVSMCIPTGELPIEQVLAKDCPTGAIIVDSATLPTTNYFDAWELNGSTVTINLTKAKEIKLARVNANGLAEAQKRQLNTLAAINNEISDSDFIASLNTKRTAIANATTVAQLDGVTE